MPPDIAIVDIQMPQWDGIKTLKAFRGHASLQDTMVIMLTSDASRETVLSAIKEGANDYVIKTSFSKEELKQKVNRLVTRRERERLGLPRFTDPQKQQAPVASQAEIPQAPVNTRKNVISGTAMGMQEVQVSAQPIVDRTSASEPVSAPLRLQWLKWNRLLRAMKVTLRTFKRLSTIGNKRQLLQTGT
ncbi:MAG: response regulator [Planctomycetaceae bacterium]